ncbi:MAG: alpha/beta hydrolase [Rheinheimera sp.]|nr:alpha/beta hydrolase [Rheinheimera sp.]
MNVLFVHGMGRSPLSGWPLLRELRHNGLNTYNFSYFVCAKAFAEIKTRLQQQIVELAKQGDYVLIGHSLGGGGVRGALNAIEKDIAQPKHLFLLGSPISPSILAQRLSKNVLYKLITGDCVKLLCSFERMNAIGAVGIPTTCIIGTSICFYRQPFFSGQINDGFVSLPEISADWFTEDIQLPFYP